MTKSPIKWRVSDRPTGRYRSFEKRAWPMAERKSDGQPLFRITCEDDYTNGKPPHAPLKMRVAIRDRESWRWVTYKRTFATLQEAKEFAAQEYATRPSMFPIDKTNGERSSKQAEHVSYEDAGAKPVALPIIDQLRDIHSFIVIGTNLPTAANFRRIADKLDKVIEQLQQEN